MQLILLRHGQSTLNVSKRHQHKDDPLSELGRTQVNLVVPKLLQYSFDKIIVSDHTRAIETATIVNSYIQKPIEQTNIIAEIRRPSAIIGKLHDDPKIQETKNEIQKHFHDPHWRHSDEENFHDVKQRAIEFIEWAEKQEENTILAVTHGMFIRITLGIILRGKAMSSYDFLEIEPTVQTDNTCLTVCAFENGKWAITTLCDSSHLT
jgi:broad specificity phosphatase PhoE